MDVFESQVGEVIGFGDYLSEGVVWEREGEDIGWGCLNIIWFWDRVKVFFFYKS